MAKIKLTKGELKRQRDSLEQFRHYLPTLQLKKQQLQMKILEVRTLLNQKKDNIRDQEDAMQSWVGLLGDPAVTGGDVFLAAAKDIVNIRSFVVPETVTTDIVNIAGANIPVVRTITFKEPAYDFYEAPLWIDKAIGELKKTISLVIERAVIARQLKILSHELRVTTQRVNLFEKVKIPECLENIRKIRIYLGDQQANAVGISKVAKKKIEEAMLQEMLV